MAVDNSAYEAAKNKKDRPKNQSSSEPIGFDLTADYQAGVQLAHAKLRAFHQGLTDELGKAQTFMNTEFQSGSFAIAANYTRALPASTESTNNSFIAMLYGSDDEEITQD